MPTLNFSLISDNDDRTSLLSEVISNFEQKSDLKIQKQVLSWNDAWQQMLDFSLSGETPDVSHIGSSWSNSLSAMNVLRPFSQDEINDFSGPDAFFQTAWKSAYASDGKTVWAIPWSTFTYVLVYRRDLIAKAGVEELAAFDTAEDMDNVIAALQAAGVKIPWVIETAATWDLIHIAASWVWGAGGNYMSANGTKILFHKPKALAGLSDFFKLSRFLSPESKYLNAQQSFDLFRQGKCAVTVVAGDSVHNLLNSDYSAPEVCANLGTAALPGSPWVGGDNLVIWKNTRLNQSRTQAALDFVRYLTRKETQVNLYQSAGLLPTRVDAFNQIAMKPPALKPTLARVFNRGQIHPPYKLWSQVEIELRQAFNQILWDLLEDPTAEVTPVLEKKLKPLGLKFEQMLQ